MESPPANRCEIQGELFQIGGRGETISLYLRNEGKVFICAATRQQGREISEYLFRQVRIHGSGKWIRSEQGKWKLVGFTLFSFSPMENTRIVAAVAAIRKLGCALEIKSDMSSIDDEE